MKDNIFPRKEFPIIDPLPDDAVEQIMRFTRPAFSMEEPTTAKTESAMGKRLSDDPGDAVLVANTENWTYQEREVWREWFAEMKRMEALKSKAPCIARLNDLADWSEKKD